MDSMDQALRYIDAHRDATIAPVETDSEGRRKMERAENQSNMKTAPLKI